MLGQTQSNIFFLCSYERENRLAIVSALSSSIWRLSKIIMIIGSSWGKFLNKNIIIVSQRMQLIQCTPSWHIAHASALNLSLPLFPSLVLSFARFFLILPLCSEDSRLDLVYVFEFPIVANIYSQDRCRAFSCFQQFKLVLVPFLISSKIMQPTEPAKRRSSDFNHDLMCTQRCACTCTDNRHTHTFIAFITRLIYNLKSEEK